MKVASLLIAIFTLSLLLIPMMALGFDPAPQSSPALDTPGAPAVSQAPRESDSRRGLEVAEPVAEEPSDVASGLSANGVSSFLILDESTGEVVEVPLRDFVRGAVAAEMPVSFHPEALKAQAVAAHTFALHNHYVQQQNPDPGLKGADFAADPSHMLVYITEETAREFYGDEADLYWGKICDAADSVLCYVMEYGDEPIVAAYHAISAGQTEDASNVWSGSAPYLQSAASFGDYLAPDYETVVLLSGTAVENALRTAYPDAELPGDPAQWFADIERSDAGYVTGISIGGVLVHGKDIRTLFDLRSHNIDIEYQEQADRFAFYVYGYGHGVGLSQYGADFLARQGATFDEILRSYYAGVSLREIPPELTQ